MNKEQKPIELGVSGIESQEKGMGAPADDTTMNPLPTPEAPGIVVPPPPAGKSLTKEEVDEINEGCKKVLIEVLDFLEIEYSMCTTETSQSGSGPMLRLNTKWMFEHKPDAKIYKGNFFFTPADKPEDAKQVIAMQVTLNGNLMGAGYYIMADVMTRFALPDPSRNSPPELFIRAVLDQLKQSGKITWMQAAGAVAQVIHLEQNINEIYGIMNDATLQAAANKQGIKIAKR